MVAFNFSVFLDKVENRTKRRTIRKTRRCKVGDKIQLYTGMRTRKCRKLVEDDPTCTLTIAISIYDENNLHCEGHRQSDETREGFAKADGFNSFAEMAAWFDNKYGLPFNGYVHQWDWATDKAIEAAE